MNVSDVIERVAEIRLHQGDPELAHGMEDVLYLDVLRAVAAGAPNAQKMAAEAIKTVEMTFTRG